MYGEMGMETKERKKERRESALTHTAICNVRSNEQTNLLSEQRLKWICVRERAVGK